MEWMGWGGLGGKGSRQQQQQMDGAPRGGGGGSGFAGEGASECVRCVDTDGHSHTHLSRQATAGLPGQGGTELDGRAGDGTGHLARRRRRLRAGGGGGGGTHRRPCSRGVCACVEGVCPTWSPAALPSGEPVRPQAEGPGVGGRRVSVCEQASSVRRSLAALGGLRVSLRRRGQSAPARGPILGGLAGRHGRAAARAQGKKRDVHEVPLPVASPVRRRFHSTRKLSCLPSSTRDAAQAALARLRALRVRERGRGRAGLRGTRLRSPSSWVLYLQVTPYLSYRKTYLKGFHFALDARAVRRIRISKRESSATATLEGRVGRAGKIRRGTVPIQFTRREYRLLGNPSVCLHGGTGTGTWGWLRLDPPSPVVASRGAMTRHGGTYSFILRCMPARQRRPSRLAVAMLSLQRASRCEHFQV